MSKRRAMIPIVLLILLVTVGIFLLFQTEVGKTIFAGIEVVFEPLQGKTHQAVTGIAGLGKDAKLEALTTQNRQLLTELSQMQELKRENQALQDQFQTQSIPTHSLLSAEVIGSRSFIPGVSQPDSLILSKGQKDGVNVGSAVVYKNNLVGKITTVFPHTAEVMLVTNDASSLTAKTSKTNALGIAKGDSGNGVVLDNVILSDTLQKGDIVLSKGDVNKNNIGVPPGLVIGKILAIHKQASSLFQTADVGSLLDFPRLETVFILIK